MTDHESEQGRVNGRDRAADLPPAGDVLGQAWALYLSSGFRYWGAVAEAWADVLRAVSDASDTGASDATARAVHLDELRARLRELVERPTREGTRFLAELDRVLAAARPPDPGPAAAWQRHGEITD